MHLAKSAKNKIALYKIATRCSRAKMVMKKTVLVYQKIVDSIKEKVFEIISIRCQNDAGSIFRKRKGLFMFMTG